MSGGGVDVLAWIDEHFPDTDTDTGDGRSGRWLRHLMFVRYGLGESFTSLVPFRIAAAHRHDPLPLSAMRYIAANWRTDADA